MSDHGPFRWLEMIPGGQTDAPTFWWPAIRFMQGAEKFSELSLLLNDLTASWNGLTSVRCLQDEVGKETPNLIPVGPLGIEVEHKRKATLLASESLYHIRSALDQVIYQAAWRNTGARNSRTAFPLCEKRVDWKARIKKELSGLDNNAIDFIKEVQPFNDTTWTTNLSNLSNRDKHRTTVEVTPSIRFKVDLSKRWADELGDPRYVGLQIEDPVLYLRIIPAEHDGEGTERLDASITLIEIAKGASDVINYFLPQEGLNPIDVQLPPGFPSS